MFYHWTAITSTFAIGFVAFLSDSSSIYSETQYVDVSHLENVVSACPDNKLPVSTPDNFVSIHNLNVSALFNISDLPMQNSFSDQNNSSYFGEGNNYSKKIKQDCNGHGLYMIAQPEIAMVNHEGQKMMRLVVCNKTANIISFSGPFGCLPIIQEALNENGQWKPLEHNNLGFCGRSYFHTYLLPDRYWEFAVPRYQGSFKTKIRFVCTQLPEWKSNEFDGSINPDQFVREPY